MPLGAVLLRANTSDPRSLISFPRVSTSSVAVAVMALSAVSVRAERWLSLVC